MREKEQLGEGQRERERERERETESEAGSRLWKVSTEPEAGLKPVSCEPWDHNLSWSLMLNLLSHPGAPLRYVFPLNSIATNFKNLEKGVPRCLSRLSIGLWLRSWSHGSWVRSLPRTLRWEQGAFLRFSVSLPLSLPLHPLPKMNKH